jgi:hypothetical protein
VKTYFRSVTAYPQQKNANGIVMRLIDGLGYRFYWATEGLTKEDYAFSPGSGCMTIGELIGHVWGLVNWIHGNLFGEAIADEKPEGLDEQQEQVFAGLYSIRRHVEALDQEALFALQIAGKPFWHCINGPFSDALTHTGQINSFRRLNGNVVPAHRPFLCYQE